MEQKRSTMDQVKFFKGCFPKILLGLFLNALSEILIRFLIRALFEMRNFLWGGAY